MQAGDLDSPNILRNAAWMTGITESTQKLSTEHGSFADKISQKAGSIGNAVANAAARAKGAAYTSKGNYTDTLSN